MGAALWVGTAMFPPLTTDPVIVAISWALKGAGLGMFTTAASAWVSRYMSDETRGRGLSWWSATNPVATAMAPPLAIWVIATHGFTAAFGLSVVASLIALCAGLVPSTAEPGDGTAKTRLLGSALLPGAIGLLLAVAATGFMVFVPLGLGGGPAGLAGWPLTLFAVGSFVIRVVSGPAVDTIGAVPTIRAGLVVVAIGIALVGVPSPYPVLLVASVVLGAGVGTLAPALAAWTAERSPRATRGAATGTYFLIYEIGLILGGATFGAALGLIGDTAYIATGVILLILGLLATAGSTRQCPEATPSPVER